jgi:methylenetetrahydrofolate dehydrogenase (NADP+)/methenyltetrahydrofolate cyclohydrolase
VSTLGAAAARVLDGRPIAAAIRAEVSVQLAAVAERTGRTPAIAVVLVGDDPPSRIYADRILRSAESVGAPGELIELPATASSTDVRERLAVLSADPDVGGIILQLPLPDHISRVTVIESIDPDKDLDGMHPSNAGLVAQGFEAFAPSCAEAALTVLKACSIPLAGRRAVVIGRSPVVGKPAALLLLREHATVTVCHRQTRELAAQVRAAEIVVAAAGSPGLVTGDMVAPGAVVVDCGINVVNGRVVGDVDDESVAPVAGAFSPVPGGIGPVTNAVLLRHLALAARRSSAA